MSIRRVTIATTVDPDVVDLTMTFAGEKSGQLVYYTITAESLDAAHLSESTDTMVEDAYTWYGITPP